MDPRGVARRRRRTLAAALERRTFAPAVPNLVDVIRVRIRARRRGHREVEAQRGGIDRGTGRDVAGHVELNEPTTNRARTLVRATHVDVAEAIAERARRRLDERVVLVWRDVERERLNRKRKCKDGYTDGHSNSHRSSPLRAHASVHGLAAREPPPDSATPVKRRHHKRSKPERASQVADKPCHNSIATSDRDTPNTQSKIDSLVRGSEQDRHELSD